MTNRFTNQIGVLCALVILPVVMVLMNGKDALQAILYRPAESAEVTSEKSEDVPQKEAKKVEEPPGKVRPLTFGAYDPTGELADHQNLMIQHIYVSWVQFEEKELREQIASIESAGRQFLLTIEPWPEIDAKDSLLVDITQGKYDEQIRQLSSILSETSGTNYVSWGHEMDQELTERYPWSGKDPLEFIAAYRYVADRIKAAAGPNLKWLWVGVLKDTSAKYWPGDEYVDFIGLPIYSFPAWDQKTYGFIRDFRTTFEEKQSFVADLNKPLMITELGISGSGDFENFWLHQAFLALDDYPRLAAVLFFHARDTEGAWGRDFETPDWRVHPESIRGMVDWKITGYSSKE